MEDFVNGFYIKPDCNKNYLSETYLDGSTYKFPNDVKEKLKANQYLAGTKDVHPTRYGDINFKCAEHEVYQVKF